MSNERQRNVLINLLILSCLLFSFNPISGQAIGGNTVFNFITLSPSAKTTALGGLNISHLNADLGMAVHQPAFLNQEMNGQLHL
ncbi:MAG: hypothetical protein ACK5BD_07805, partial [Chitinophagaceae bacterium]